MTLFKLFNFKWFNLKWFSFKWVPIMFNLFQCFFSLKMWLNYSLHYEKFTGRFILIIINYQRILLSLNHFHFWEFESVRISKISLIVTKIWRSTFFRFFQQCIVLKNPIIVKKPKNPRTQVCGNFWNLFICSKDINYWVFKKFDIAPTVYRYFW